MSSGHEKKLSRRYIARAYLPPLGHNPAMYIYSLKQWMNYLTNQILHLGWIYNKPLRGRWTQNNDIDRLLIDCWSIVDRWRWPIVNLFELLNIEQTEIARLIFLKLYFFSIITARLNFDIVRIITKMITTIENVIIIIFQACNRHYLLESVQYKRK